MVENNNKNTIKTKNNREEYITKKLCAVEVLKHIKHEIDVAKISAVSLLIGIIGVTINEGVGILIWVLFLVVLGFKEYSVFMEERRLREKYLKEDEKGEKDGKQQ